MVNALLLGTHAGFNRPPQSGRYFSVSRSKVDWKLLKAWCCSCEWEGAAVTFPAATYWLPHTPHIYNVNADRLQLLGVILSRKWDTAPESWNMSKKLGQILLNTASWHLLLETLTRKPAASLTCIFVVPRTPEPVHWVRRAGDSGSNSVIRHQSLSVSQLNWITYCSHVKPVGNGS